MGYKSKSAICLLFKMLITKETTQLNCSIYLQLSTCTRKVVFVKLSMQIYNSTLNLLYLFSLFCVPTQQHKIMCTRTIFRKPRCRYLIVYVFWVNTYFFFLFLFYMLPLLHLLFVFLAFFVSIHTNMVKLIFDKKAA